jgi:hypothetical protein
MSLPELFRRAEQREGIGNAAGAERLYEAGAIGGDLVALARLAQLRGLLGPPRAGDDAAQARRLFEQASAEGNTGTLFSLAAAGDENALSALRRMRDRAAAPPVVDLPEPEGAARTASVPTAGPEGRNRRAASKPQTEVRRAPRRKARRRKR